MRKMGWRTALVVVLGAIVIVGAYQLGRVRAEGAPTSTPLYYSGFATDGGTPIDGLRDIRIELWRDATSTDAAMRACETIRNNAPFVDGHFRVALDDTCVAATRGEPNLFVELTIAGTRIGERAAVGAVPYALEADHALSTNAVRPGSLMHVTAPTCVTTAGNLDSRCTCPSGTVVLGGGANAPLGGPSLRTSRAVDARTWQVACIDGAGAPILCIDPSLVCMRVN